MRAIDPEQRQRIAKFCKQNRIRRLAVFGSAMRGDERSDSDFDLLVEFETDAGVGLLDLSRMQDELTLIIGRNVDLRTLRELSRYIRDEVVNSAIELYAA